jgi:hypothetical protein
MRLATACQPLLLLLPLSRNLISRKELSRRILRPLSETQ